MTKKSIGLFAWIFLLAGKTVSGQQANIGSYIATNIEIQYLQDPDAKSTGFLNLLSDFITQQGSVSLFGTTNNNGMDRSAELVDALFKSSLITTAKSISKSASPDIKFQESIYHALKLSGKKIQICFINDKDGVSNKFLAEANCDYKTRGYGERTHNFIWPGTFKVATKEYAGRIVIGETGLRQESLENAK